MKVSLSIACAQCSRASPMSEVGTAVCTLLCTCAGLREYFGGLPNPLGVCMDTSHPPAAMQPAPGSEHTAQPSGGPQQGFLLEDVG